MFDQLKSLGAVAGLLKNKEKLQSSMDEVKKHLEALRIDGTSGGGAVRVTLTGRLEVVGVKIDPAMARSMGTGDSARIKAEELIGAAMADALTRAQDAAKDAIARKMRDLGLPDLSGQLSGLLG